jgi:hypothetical protein
VLSDFFERGAGIRGLQYLAYRGLTPVVLQVVARSEIAPELASDSELIDIERPDGERLVVDASAVSAYRARLAQHEALLREFCAAHKCPHGRIMSDMPFHQVVGVLQGIGVISAGDV